MKTKIIFKALVAILIVVAFSLIMLYHFNTLDKIINETSDYITKIQKKENMFISSIPIYSDYSTPAKEKILRRYLLKDHLKIAQKRGIGPLKNNDDLTRFIKFNKLLKIETGDDYLYYFYGVKKNNRYLTPETYDGLNKLTQRFQENLNKYKNLPPVKIAISSAIRTAEYQKKLRTINNNASVLSTHNYGTSFDIFFEDYFVKLPVYRTSSDASKKIQLLLRRKFGFILGDSLRRQLKSVLMETLIQLQNEGILYCILERRQRCYHVTIL